MNMKWLKTLMDKRGTTILTSAGLAFDISCAITAGRATVIANRMIEAKMEDVERELTAQEKIELTWKVFMLPAGLGLAGAACHIGSTIKSNRKQAALMGVAGAAETAYTRLKEEMPEVVGKNKAAKIEEAAAQRAARENIPQNEEGIERIRRQEMYGPRNVLVYDSFQGRWFYTNTEEITHVQNVIQGMQNGNPNEPVELNQVNYEFGLKGSKTGEAHVWTKDYDDLMSMLWYGGDGTFLREDGTEEPYLVLKYDPEPRLWYTE